MIIKRAIKKACRKAGKKDFRFALTSYQPRGLGYETRHICWSPVENEMLRDVKRILKPSVSFFVGFALDLYLDEIINELVNGIERCYEMDSYPDSHYTFAYSKVEGVDILLFLWGHPPQNQENQKND